MFSALCISRLTEGSVHRVGFSESCLIPWIEECLTILRTRKEKAYHLFKLFDGILVAGIIYKEKAWDNPDFYKTNTDAVNEDESLGHQWRDSLLEHLLEKMTPDEMVDIIGTCKLFGFPEIDFAAGMEKLYEATHKHVCGVCGWWLGSLTWPELD